MSREWRGPRMPSIVSAVASPSCSSADSSAGRVTVKSNQGHTASSPESTLDSSNHNVFLKGSEKLERLERRSTASTFASKNSMKSVGSPPSGSLSESATTKKALACLDDDPSLRSVASECQSSFAFNDSISLLRESDEPDDVQISLPLQDQQECRPKRDGATSQSPADEAGGGILKVNDAPDPISSAQRRSVSFSTVELYVHSRALGDNPSVSAGPPIALGPKLVRTERHEVDKYEWFREETVPRRSKRGLLLGRVDREDLLKDYGYSRSDFVAAELEVRKLQVQRRSSSRRSLLERAVRKARKLFPTTSTSQHVPRSAGASEHKQF